MLDGLLLEKHIEYMMKIRPIANRSLATGTQGSSTLRSVGRRIWRSRLYDSRYMQNSSVVGHEFFNDLPCASSKDLVLTRSMAF